MEVNKGNTIGHSSKMMAFSKWGCMEPIRVMKKCARRILNIAEGNTNAKGHLSFREYRPTKKAWHLSVQP